VKVACSRASGQPKRGREERFAGQRRHGARCRLAPAGGSRLVSLEKSGPCADTAVSSDVPAESSSSPTDGSFASGCSPPRLDEQLPSATGW